MIITPEKYSDHSAYDLLHQAAQARVAIDHRLLHVLVDEPARTLPDIVRFACEDHDAARLDLEDELVLIARYLRAAELIPFLVDCVGRYEDDVPDFLVESVCEFGVRALEPLLALLEETGLGTGSEAPFLIAALGVQDERIERMLERLREANPEEAAFCLDIYRGFANGTAEAEPFDIWAEYPEVADPPYEILMPEERLEFLDVDSVELRASAASSFSHDPELPKEVTDRLHDIARVDSSPKVRAEAWRSLTLEIEDDDLVTEMRERLFDPATLVEEQAGLAVALAPRGTDQKLQELVVKLFERPETRVAALEAMWRSCDLSYSSYVQAALDDDLPEIREQAVMGVGYLGLPGELGRIKAMFDDPELRPAALLAYGLAVPHEISPGRMKGLFRKIEKLAEGLDPEDADIVHLALNQRLAAAGHEPMFNVDDNDDE